MTKMVEYVPFTVKEILNTNTTNIPTIQRNVGTFEFGKPYNKLPDTRLPYSALNNDEIDQINKFKFDLKIFNDLRK